MSHAPFLRNPGDPATVVIGNYLPLVTRPIEYGVSMADQNYKYSLRAKRHFQRNNNSMILCKF